MCEAAKTAGAESGHVRAARIPPGAERVEWNHPSRAIDAGLKKLVDRYGVVITLLAAGIDAARIQVYREPMEHGTYWVVVLGDGRTVVLTDDTEEQVTWLEGPWPFAVTFTGRDGGQTEIEYSIDRLLTRIIAWCNS